MTQIKRLPGETARTVSAAQAIADLPAAAKELLENALDAGATAVTVTVRRSGLDGLEVADDGCGIAAEDLALVGERGCTSKIASDEEMLRVQTFGFRGEALHAIAAVSKGLTIRSRRADATGHELALESTSGQRTTRALTMNTGTTVLVSGFLSAFPVRLGEWQRHAPRVLGRLVALLQTYAVAAPAVRLRLVHQRTAGAPPDVLVATSGSADPARAYAEAFRATAVLRTVSDEVRWCRCPTRLRLFHLPIGGGVSGAGAEWTRRQADRQIVLLRGRPIELPRLMRRLNDTLRGAAGSESGVFPPLLVYIDPVDADGDAPMVDVNFAPDKRQALLDGEAELFDAVVSLLTRALADSSRVLAVAPPASSAPERAQQSTLPVVRTAPSLPPPSHPSRAIGLDAQPGPVAPAQSRAYPETDAQPERSAQEGSTCCEHGEELLAESAADAALLQDVPLARSDFGRMHVIGQFNRGFIIAHLPAVDAQGAARQGTARQGAEGQGAEGQGAEGQDAKEQGIEGQSTDSRAKRLFIIDQHAADERARLEQLEGALSWKRQTLIAPCSLKGLGADLAALAEEHVALLAQYGFVLEPVGGSLALTAVPTVVIDAAAGTTLTLDVKDLGEALALLQRHDTELASSDVPDSCASDSAAAAAQFEGLHSLGRVATVLASRACRGAIMIGQHLGRAEMQRVLARLTTLRRPWICAHGRPTVRLLG